MEVIGCLVPELWGEAHRHTSFRENTMFYVVTVKCNVSVRIKLTLTRIQYFSGQLRTGNFFARARRLSKLS